MTPPKPEVSKTTLINLPYFSDGFPKLDSNLIKRENIINLIESEFKEDEQIIFLEGGEDSGKTTLCAQFCKKNNKNTISIFFNPLNIIDYHIDYFYTNVVSQIRFYLGDSIEEIENTDFVGYEEYRKYLFQLRKKIKRGTIVIYLVIDGLEDKTFSNQELIKEILDNLPYGDDYFKIIITGDRNEYFKINKIIEKTPSKSITLSGFTTHEIKTYLEFGDDNYNYNELYQVTKGYPGRLKTLKRILKQNNYNLNDIDTQTTYKTWIDIDCSGIDIENNFNKIVLSIIALGDDKFNSEDISIILSKSLSETEESLNKIYVLECQKDNINFISNAHKSYYKNILRVHSRTVDELLRKYYASEDSINSRLKLLKLLAKDNMWKQIPPIINEEFLINTLNNYGSLKIVNETVEMGYNAAEQMKSYSDLCKYSVQGSIVNELDNYLFWESEILARISLDDFVGAISLANSAVLVVDRLRLLALIARKQKQKKKTVDEELINLIQNLYERVDLSGVGNVIYDIVSDLIYAMPNLAIEIIENSSGNASEKDINDWIIAKLSLAAIDSSENNKSDETKKLTAIQNLNNPSVRKINSAIAFLVGNYSSVKVLEEVEKLSDSKERLKLLRLWLINNKKHKQNVELVIEKSLDELVVISSNEILTIEILKDISKQLANVKEYDKRRLLLERFKSFENHLKDLGLSKDKYIYKLNVFHAEYTLHKEKAIPILDNIIREISGHNDVLVKIESFSEVYAKLHIMHKKLFEKRIKFIYSNILQLSDEVYHSTANHYKASKNFLKSIAKVNPIFALKISNNINIEIYRDKSKLLILDSYLDNNVRHINIKFLKIIEEQIVGEIPKNIALKNILERYNNSNNLYFSIIKDLFYFAKKIPQKINVPSNIIYFYLLYYGIVSKNKEFKNRLGNGIKKHINTQWEEIEADWEKIDAGFIISSEVAEIDPEFSRLVFQKALKVKQNSWIDSNSIAQTYILCLRLVLKAYNGLLISQLERERDFNEVEKLINRLPSEVERLKLWSELCINCLTCNKIELAKKIYDSHIFSLVKGLLDKGAILKGITESLILLYWFNRNIAI